MPAPFRPARALAAAPLARTALAGAALLLGGACYKVTVVTAPEPANAAVLDKPWTHSFVVGLVPPAEIDASKPCTRGVAKVVTQRSFLNSLVAALTSSIYTPLQVTVTCANAASASAAPAAGTAVAGTTPAPTPVARDSAAAR